MDLRNELELVRSEIDGFGAVVSDPVEFNKLNRLRVALEVVIEHLNKKGVEV